MPMFGFINLRKPQGITSHDAVVRVRQICKISQVGHAGTLDLLAEGVLPVALGKACRLIRWFPGSKVYKAEILLGTVTETDDIEGQVLAVSDKLPGPETIAARLVEFTGSQEQAPPIYSAVRHEGKRLYELAREGKTIPEIRKKPIRITSIDLLDVTLPVVHIRVSCSAGTYIRSLARDLGDALGCGGCLQALTREQSGPFHIGSSCSLGQLEQLAGMSCLAQAIASPQDVLGLESFQLSDEELAFVAHGRSIACQKDFAGAVLAMSGAFLVAVLQPAQDKLKPEVVLINGIQYTR